MDATPLLLLRDIVLREERLMCLRRWVLSRWVSPNSPKAKGGGPSCLPMFEDVAGNTHGCYTVIAAQGDFAKAGAAGLSVQVSVEQRA